MESKRIIITGATGTVGTELSHLLASEGHSLILVARTKEPLKILKEECIQRGAKSVIDLACDIRLIHDAKRIAESLIDLQNEEEIVLMNNVGAYHTQPFDQISYEEIENLVMTNLLGTMYVTRSILPLMLSQGSGQIIDMGSVGATLLQKDAAVYNASKAGLLAFGKTLIKEVRGYGIRITSVLPGSISASSSKEETPHKEDALLAWNVAEFLRDLIMMPKNRCIDEVVLMPPKSRL